MTPLDRAAAAMAEDEAASPAFHAHLAAAELFLLLDTEPEGETIRPRLFPLETGATALAFDTEERLAGFAGAAPYAALSGRTLAALLAGKDVALGLNFGTEAPSETLLPSGVLDWLAEQAVAAAIATERPIGIAAPDDLPDALLPAIEPRLAAAAGLARQAILATARYADGTVRPLLALVDAADGADTALAATLGEALVFAGLPPDSLDIAVVPETAAITAPLRRHGLAIDIPAPSDRAAPGAPGTDPDRPPKLR
ncbi:SseB family protein [Rhodobacterales bacterium HKCCE3408]|nr:SseB family protein [Rhodobacterales bacterium HKCCE3408]